MGKEKLTEKELKFIQNLKNPEWYKLIVKFLAAIAGVGLVGYIFMYSICDKTGRGSDLCKSQTISQAAFFVVLISSLAELSLVRYRFRKIINKLLE